MTLQIIPSSKLDCRTGHALRRSYPLKVAFGSRSLATLPSVLSRAGVRRVFLVTGRQSYAASGAQQRIESLIGAFNVVRFSDISINPTLEDLEVGVQALRADNFDAVVAVGGGSVMDFAKAIAVLARQPADPAAYVCKGVTIARPRRVLLALCPTTAGTGSEVTRFSAIFASGRKRSLDHPWVRADYAFVEPDLCLSMSKQLSAVTAMDALCQAIESHWSIRSTYKSRALAAWAIRLILQHANEELCPDDVVQTTAMCQAALMSGQAIDITRTTACHAVSYSLMQLFGVPHGLACALTLRGFLRYNAAVVEDDVRDARGVSFVRHAIRETLDLFGADTVDEACDLIEALMVRQGLPTRLGALGITESSVEQVLKDGFDPSRAANNPRTVTPEAVRRILYEIL